MREGGSRLCFVRDPDSHVIEITTYEPPVI